ncbi:T9SS type A sorting domain-containing protein [Flavobacterium silvaticum]|uniref:T9SS type A sorting domain-containing protein n=1 Tax=Flavobacterium silvaticum TaxID=1852020 RepID=A0A972JI43_9FLAO|nr:T9SS type A sorting domain-containing protein [Flavobacterium silvaticum]NMH28605.1 T9SS type A sorting domain-containing protein [Flavobacterium silvaticum]
MKKIMLAAGLLLCGFANAQLTFTSFGEPIIDNHVYEYDTFYNMQIRVANESEDETVYMKARVDDMVNATGQNAQLCFGGICLFTLSENLQVPPSFPAILEPGQTTSAEDHMWNTNAGDGVNYPMDYVLSFHKITEDGEPIEQLLSFTYRYNPQLGLKGVSLSQIGIRNLNTVLDASLNINTTIALNMEIVNLNGQVIQNKKVVEGQQSFDVSNLNQGMYIIRFTNDQNVSAQVKVMKK